MENPKKQLVDRILNFRKRKQLFNTVKSWIASGTSNTHAINEQSQRKGTEFEAFVVRRFNPAYFTLLEWRSDKSVDQTFPLMSKFPDLEFYYQPEEKFIAIECKWRESFKEEKISLNKFHIENYLHYQSVMEIDTYIVLGVGNTASYPNHVYIIPLKEITSETLHEFQIEIFKRKNPHQNFFLNCSIGRLT